MQKIIKCFICITLIFASPLYAKTNACLDNFYSFVKGTGLSVQIDLSYCELNDADIALLESKISELKREIYSLLLEGDAITDSGMTNLLDYIYHNQFNDRAHFELGLDDNPISDATIDIVIKFPNLELLWLDNIKSISTNSLSQIASLKILTDLTLSGDHISDDGALALSKSTSISKLIINSNEIGSVGAFALAINKSIKIMDLSCNNIYDPGAFALALKQMRYLSVEYNQIEYPGISTLESAFANGIITELHAGHNPGNTYRETSRCYIKEK